MSPEQGRARSAWWGIGLCGVAMLLVLAFEEPAVAVVPFVLAIAGYALWRLPLRYSSLGLIGIALTLENPAERPYEGKWKSFLSVPGAWLFDNMNNVTGIRPLRFSLLDLVLATLALVVYLRRRDLAKDTGPPAAAVTLFLVVMMAGVLGLELYGIGRGGDFKSSLWQVRQLFWFPIVALIFQATFRGSRDLYAIGAVVMLSAFIRAGVGFYYYEVICKPENIKPFYLTTHSDTVLFVTVVMMAIVYFLFVRAPSRWWVLLTGVPIAGVAIILNNRRIAFVSLAMDLALTYFVMPASPLKKSLARALLAAVPAFGLYFVVGQYSNATIFAPVKMASTVTTGEDASSETRDIENYNLIHTLQHRPIGGWGFGHEYIEYSRAHDISSVFALYRYIGHNSVLWLWVVGGLIGFFLVWTVVALAFYLAARAYRGSTDANDQVGSLVALTIPLTFAIQSYGDMGLQSWTGLFILTAAIGAMSKLVVEIGAWPPALARAPRGPPACAVPLAGGEVEASS